MDWVEDFYSTTGSWWGKAEAVITDRDHRRVQLVHAYVGDEPVRVLELGSGYGMTAAATAQAGHAVTAVDVSDRASFTGRFVDAVAPGSLTALRADFYTVDFPHQFDVVTYWDGFGVGSDADQRKLLTRIATEWLRPGGVALLDVFNPFVWARWDGDEEHRTPNPAAGYDYELHERTSFDPVTCTATDTWWQASDPYNKISQRLRCYTPADLALLLDGAQLVLSAIHVGDQFDEPTSRPELLHEHYAYVAVLRHRD